MAQLRTRQEELAFVEADFSKSGEAVYHHERRDEFRSVGAFGEAYCDILSFESTAAFTTVLQENNLTSHSGEPDEYKLEEDTQQVTVGEQGAFRYVWSNPCVMLVTECNPTDGSLFLDSPSLSTSCAGAIGIEGDELSVRRLFDDLLDGGDHETSKSPVFGSRRRI